MNGLMNENDMVKDYEFDEPLIQKIDSIVDDCISDCHHKYFHTFDHICESDIQLTNNGNNETLSITISDKSMGLYELNKKLTLARERGYIFNQINNFKIKIYSNLSNINIHHHLRLGTPPLHRQFFMKITKNRDYNQKFCNDRRNPFHLARCQWFLYNNPGILT